MGNAKDTVLAAAKELFADKDATAVDRWAAPDYQQHSSLAPDGPDGLRGLVANLPEGFSYEGARVIADGDLVALHGIYYGFGPDPLVAFDLFRVSGGKLAEHWDALTPLVQDTASGRSQTDGPTEVGDLDHWTTQYWQMQVALNSGKTFTAFEVGDIAPPWPDARVQSELLALFDRHMAVSLSSETLGRSLELVFSVFPPPEWTNLPRRLQWIMAETIRFIERARTPQLFAARMREAKLFSGLSLLGISERTAHPSIRHVTGRNKVAVSTLSNLCNPRHGRFPTTETLRAFLMAIDAPEQMIEVWEKVRFIVTVTPGDDIEEVHRIEEWLSFANRYQTETVVGAQVNMGALGTASRGSITLPPPRTSP